nr:MAG TPA: hypothetical protein [Caudoviricetes sp.]
MRIYDGKRAITALFYYCSVHELYTNNTKFNFLHTALNSYKR